MPAEPVSGSERLVWDQSLGAADLSNYRFVAYVDGVRQDLADASCTPALAGNTAECIASLPHMTAGAHRLELASVVDQNGTEVESSRSAVLQLVVAASTASGTRAPATARPATSSTPRTAADGSQFFVESIATDLTSPSAVVVLPDNRLLVAEASGTIRMSHTAAWTGEPALTLRDVAVGPDVGLVGMAADPQFARTHQVVVVYTAEDAAGRLANRVVRYRVLETTLAEPAALLEDTIDEPPLRTPRARFGPDGKLYVAFPAGADGASAGDAAVYSGKILRLNDDGTTPRDNPGFSPIVSRPHRAPGAFAWDRRGRLWLVDRDSTGQDALYASLTSATPVYRFDSLVDASAAAFLTGSVANSFSGSVFIAALDGRHIRRVQFDDSGGVRETERMVDGEFGRISDIVADNGGGLYFCTSNSAAGAKAGHDALLRLSPR